MIPLVLAACLSAVDATVPPPAAAAPDEASPAVLYVPRPDVLSGKLKGSPLQGFSPWFVTKAVTRRPWLVVWDGSPLHTPQAFAGSGAQSSPWLRDAKVTPLLANPADLVGTLDLTHVFHQAMLGTPENVRQIFRRLGLESLQAARGTADVRGDHAVDAQATLELTADNRGLFGALEPAAPKVHPSSVPPKASDWSAAWVIPAKVWEVAETVAGLTAPIQYGLARAQLDILEDSMKTRWREDVLGYAPRIWAAYALPTGEHVAVLEIQKGASAAAFVRETLATLRDIIKEMTFEETKTSSATSWVVHLDRRDVYIAVAGDTLVMANNVGGLNNHLAFHGTAAPVHEDVRKDPASPVLAVAWGVHDDAQFAKRLAAFGHDGGFRAASKALDAAPLAVKDALKYFGNSEWWIDPISEGFALRIVARPSTAAKNK